MLGVMRTFDILMLVLALVCFVLAALLPGEPKYNARVRLIGAGLALVTLTWLAPLINQ